MILLNRTQFGNPILRTKTQQLTTNQIKSKPIKELIKNMHYTLQNKKYGVGLAAPQIGQPLAIAVIGSKPTPTRPHIPKLHMTIINPKITKLYGYTTPMWEGCISGPDMYGKARRYKKIQVSWLDENAQHHEEEFDGLLSQIIQHEVDHLNGVLFVDRVKDTTSYVTFSEYRKIQKSHKLKLLNHQRTTD